MTDRLWELWDFDDLDATESRLQAALTTEKSGEGQAKVLTQLARVHGLRGDFEAGEELLGEAETLGRGSDLVRARVALERGRLRRSSGDEQAALPQFEHAFATARESGHWFLAADAAHMAALVAPGRAGFVEWTRRGIQLAEEHPEAAYWAGPLLNNLGWELFEAGELEQALDAFERALRARERDEADSGAVALGRYAVGKTLRALGRSDAAVPLLEQAVAWAEQAGKPDGWFHEELAEEYSALGREADARDQAGLAVQLLEAADPSFADDGGRRRRLRALAGLAED